MAEPNVCVLNVATGRFVKGQERLEDALFGDEVRWGGDFIKWTNTYPQGSPPHPPRNQWNTPTTVPYAFKPYAFREALSLRFDVAIWLDASMVPVKPLLAIVNAILEHGYWFPPCGWSVGEWCSDQALEVLGVKRDEAMTMPLVVPGAMGVCLNDSHAVRFLKQWLALVPTAFAGPWDNVNNVASKDPRVLGHRHDQTCASFLVNRFGWKATASPKWYAVGSSKDRSWLTGEEVIIADGNY